MSEPLSDVTLLDELERLEQEATPRPWHQGETGMPDGGILLAQVDYSAAYAFIEVSDRSDDGADGVVDAALIAAMRNALPRLIAIARAAERALGIVQRATHESGAVAAGWLVATLAVEGELSPALDALNQPAPVGKTTG
jgi:hypothetical protein